MAKHLTWCLKRTFLFTNRLNVYQQSVTALKTTDYAIQSRYIASPRTNQINVDYDEPQHFDDFFEESTPSKTSTVETLIRLLSLTKENAVKTLKDYPNFKLLSKKVICANFQLLRERGLYKSTIKNNQYVLTDDTVTLRKKIQIINKFDLDINDAAPFFNLSIEELASFEKRSRMEASYYPACNRIVYLAEKLQCEVSTICRLLTYSPDIMKIPAPKILSITEYLLASGIAPEHILSDIHVYYYNISTIKERLERAKRACIKPLKPWVVRCTEDIWKKIETRQRDSKLLPGQSVRDYIRELFDCDMEYVDHLYVKDPRLLKMDVNRLKEVLTYLRDEGYKIEDLQRSPLILHRNLEVVKKRFASWRSVSPRQPSLFIFCASSTKFAQHVAEERLRNETKHPTS